MRYGINDIVKFKMRNYEYIGKIVSKCPVKIVTADSIYSIASDRIIQNFTEETEEANRKIKVNSLRRSAFDTSIGDYVVPYSKQYEDNICTYLMQGCTNSKLIYQADSIFKVKSINNNRSITFETIKHKNYRKGFTFTISKSFCEKNGYFVITEFIDSNYNSENKKNSLGESLAIAKKCDKCSCIYNNVPIITCTQKSNEERLREKEINTTYGSIEHVEYLVRSCYEYKEHIRDLEKWLAEKQEENEKLKKDLAKCISDYRQLYIEYDRLTNKLHKYIKELSELENKD